MFVGLPEGEYAYGIDSSGAITDLLDKASDKRALMIAFGLVLGSWETATYQDMLRSPGSHGDAASYFRLLVK